MSQSGSLLLPRIESDCNGSYISVECGSVSGQLYIDRLPKERAKRVGQCVLSASKWITPLEFERLGGKSAKKWKSSLFHGGRPLSDYNLVCTSAETPSAPITSDVAMQALSTMLIDVGLAFINAFRLRGDKTSLSSIVVERFDQSAVEHSKRLLWESCKEELKGAGLVYHQRRGSDKREWIDADLEDILVAFDALDAKSSVPPIYCEATELPRIPSLCLDPVSEQVQDNTRSLLALTSAVTDLEKKLSTFLTSGGTRSEASNTVGPPVCTTEATYSSVVASGQQHEQSASSTNHSSLPMKLPLRKSTSSSLPDHHDRESNVVLFGLAECASLVGTGSKLAIKDLFRLGHYKKRSGVAENAIPPRPVLIKFATPWDRRMVLMQKRKLKNFHIAHLFIQEDLSPDMRQKKSQSLSDKSKGASGHSDVSHVSLSQHDPVAEMSCNVSPAGCENLCTGDSDSTHVRSGVSPAGSESLCTGDSDSALQSTQTHPSITSLNISASDLTFSKDTEHS